MKTEKRKIYDVASSQIDAEEFIRHSFTEDTRRFIPVEEVLEKVKHSCEGCTHLEFNEYGYDGAFTITKYNERDETDEEYEARLDIEKRKILALKNKKKQWTSNLISKVGSKEEVLKLLEEIE